MNWLYVLATNPFLVTGITSWILAQLIKGFDSFEFAIAFILAAIICNDATGVRWETQKQTALLCEIVKSTEATTDQKLPSVKLRKYVGHTPLQATVGTLVGVANAILMYNVLT